MHINITTSKHVFPAIPMISPHCSNSLQTSPKASGALRLSPKGPEEAAAAHGVGFSGFRWGGFGLRKWWVSHGFIQKKRAENSVTIWQYLTIINNSDFLIFAWEMKLMWVQFQWDLVVEPKLWRAYIHIYTHVQTDWINLWINTHS